MKYDREKRRDAWYGQKSLLKTGNIGICIIATGNTDNATPVSAHHQVFESVTEIGRKHGKFLRGKLFTLLDLEHHLGFTLIADAGWGFLNAADHFTAIHRINQQSGQLPILSLHQLLHESVFLRLGDDALSAAHQNDGPSGPPTIGILLYGILYLPGIILPLSFKIIAGSVIIQR